MNAVMRLVALALAGAALAAAVLVATIPGRVAGLAELGHLFIDESALGAAREARSAEVRRCIEGKEEVIRELVAGRLTLAEAADRFGQLEAARDGLPASAKGRPELCDEVLLWAGMRLPGGPREQAEVLARLQRERAGALQVGAARSGP